MFFRAGIRPIFALASGAVQSGRETDVCRHKAARCAKLPSPIGVSVPLLLGPPLHAYIGAAGIADDRKGWLFRTARGHKGSVLSEKPMGQPDAWRMIRRRAAAAGIAEAIGCHTFRATGITAYLANGGALEHAQEMAAHESPRTTKLYDRTKERLTQDEIERIRL